MKKVIMGLFVVAWVYLIIFGITPYFLHTDSTYGSQDIFWSEQEYETFKQDVKQRVATDNLKINSFDVIASEPPIIVNYSITVPYDYTFPYGESHTHDFDILIILAMSIVTALPFIVAPASIMFGPGS